MIRLASKQDLPAIASVHSICFPKSYSTQLGKVCGIGNNNLLSRFYLEYMDDAPKLFWVAEDENNGIVGFCMGYYMNKDDQMQNFIKHNRLNLIVKTVLLMLMFNKPTWDKVLSCFKKDENLVQKIVDFSNEHIKNDMRGDLLSVCVLPEYRGKKYAQQLMDAFMNAMKESGMKLCLLSVKSDNDRAIHYYERNGFQLYRVRGEVGRTYMRKL